MPPGVSDSLREGSGFYGKIDVLNLLLGRRSRVGLHLGNVREGYWAIWEEFV
jgi:hypothetical protein